MAVGERLGYGSIPAHAGEPEDRNPFRVYPRACGGTIAIPRFANV